MCVEVQLKYAADFQDTQPGDYLKKPVPTQNRFDDNSRTYTYNTTLEWWQEYTTLPPINWVDTTRRVVNGYFTNEGCEGKNILNSVVPLNVLFYNGTDVSRIACSLRNVCAPPSRFSYLRKYFGIPAAIKYYALTHRKIQMHT